MAENEDSFLDELNEGCIDCVEDEPFLAECTTTTFAPDAPVSVTASVEASTKTEYDVCCDPVAIEPVIFSICSRGTVFFTNVTVLTVPTNGTLYIGSEEVEANDTLTKQENGLLVYKRTIDSDAEDGIQPADTDTFTLRVTTTGGNSNTITVTMNLLETECKVENPCNDCGV